jgi:hypothetical protein
MDTQQLKNNITQRINKIDDVELLKSIEYLLSTSDKNISTFLDVAYEKLQNKNADEKEDFTAYIKEWVKNM